MADSSRFRFRLPHWGWFLLVTVALVSTYGGVHWYFFRVGPRYEIGGINYALDLDRTLARGRMLNKPILIYFCGAGSANDRYMDYGVLRVADVTERLRKFEYVAAFGNNIPKAAGPDAPRFERQNIALQEELLADVSHPAFAVVCPDFTLERSGGCRMKLASFIGMTQDAAKFSQFLDAASDKWREHQHSRLAHGK